MQLTKTPFKGLFILEFPHFNDQRGAFQKLFNKGLLSDAGVDVGIDEIYYSVNHKDVIRGMHFQTPPFDHVKIVSVSNGKILDVVVDLRKEEPTYGQYFSIELNSESGKSLIIPKGMAHGFASLEDGTIVNYAQSSGYAPENDGGIAYNSFGFEWSIKNPIISNRDLAFPTFDKFQSPF